jgi:cysteine desulfurase family protein (TIGR01976 family)
MFLDIGAIRTSFPSLSSGAIYFDNPGGTQVADRVIERIQTYLETSNANHGGAFQTSQESDRIIDLTRARLAEFVNARSPGEIVFGANMTSLTFQMSRSLAALLTPGDEIIVTRMDHDANITPWTILAEERGCKVRWLDFDVEDFTLRMDQLPQLFNERTRLVAVGYASNALGTINPVRQITQMARERDVLSFIDAVQFAPHGPIDVQDLGCDFLVISAYKFFGPHVGILYGRGELLETLPAYKVRPAPDTPPDKFETGTKNHEGIAGVLGALEYFAELGAALLEEEQSVPMAESNARPAFLRAMEEIQAYEIELSRSLVNMLTDVPGTHIWGITEVDRLSDRVPTVSITLDSRTPREIAEFLGERGIYTWDGNYYALAVTERLGLEESGGMLRIGLVHYNTPEEIMRLGEALTELVRQTAG